MKTQKKSGLKNTLRRNMHALRTWVQIDGKAIAHNVRQFRSIIPKTTKLMAVVKSNAYGHGLVDFSMQAGKCGVDFFGVDSIVEALALRKKGIASPILVLGHTLPENLPLAADAGISVSVSSMESFEHIFKSSFARKLDVHLKIDTGMHRQGFLFPEISKVISMLSDKRFVSSSNLTGIYTHFAAAKNPSFPAYTKRQLSEFSQWSDALVKAGFSPIRHAAATAGTVLFPDSHLDMVRVGIGLYGLWPSAEVRAFAEKKLSLRPVLSWKSVIAETKNLKKGERVGYDLIETLSRDSTLAVVPIGYWHGYPRILSSIGHVIVKGIRARVVGRVSMDMIVIDVTDVKNPKAEDEVVLLGTDGGEIVTAEELGALSETVNYEIITRINPLIKRIAR